MIYPISYVPVLGFIMYPWWALEMWTEFQQTTT